MAEPGRYEGIRQAQLLGLPNLPGRPLWQCFGEPGPVFCRTEADGGDQTTKPAPVARCCRHLLPAAALCPFIVEGALLLPLHLRSSAAQQPSYRPQLGAGSREAVLFVSTPARPVKRQSKRHPWDGRTRGTGFCSVCSALREMMIPLLHCFCCSATGSSAGGTQTFKKAVSYVSGSQEGTDSSVRIQSRLPRPPLLSSAGSRSRFEDAMPPHSPPAQPGSQVSVAPRSQSPLRDALSSGSSPCAPLHCPTAGMSVVPLVLVQFAWRRPKFRGVRFTTVLNQDAPV